MIRLEKSNGRELNQVARDMESISSMVMNSLLREIIAVDFGHT